MPKLYNVIVVYDVYCVAESPEDAIETIKAAIVAEPPDRLANSEEVANETTSERSIRTAWLEEKPFIGSTVSDADFEALKGKSTLAQFKQLYTREEPKK